MKPHVNDSAMIPKVILLVIGFFILGANSFAPRAIKSHVRPLTRTEGRSTQPISALHAAPDNVPALFQGVYDPVYSYVNFWVENLPWSIAPDFLLHWGHPAAMGTVLIVMGGIGTYAGYEIRKGNGARDDYFFTLDGKTVRDSHPLIMGLASFFFLLGGQGGLVLLLDQGKPILDSLIHLHGVPHFYIFIDIYAFIGYLLHNSGFRGKARASTTRIIKIASQRQSVYQKITS